MTELCAGAGATAGAWGVETAGDFVVVVVFAAVLPVEEDLAFVVVVFAVVVVAFCGVVLGGAAAGAGAAATRVSVSTDGLLTTGLAAIGFVGRPRSATVQPWVLPQSETGPLCVVTAGASPLAAECATPAGSAADATMIASAAVRRTKRLVLMRLNPPDRTSHNGSRVEP